MDPTGWICEFPGIDLYRRTAGATEHEARELMKKSLVETYGRTANALIPRCRAFDASHAKRRIALWLESVKKRGMWVQVKTYYAYRYPSLPRPVSPESLNVPSDVRLYGESENTIGFGNYREDGATGQQWTACPRPFQLTLPTSESARFAVRG